MYLVSFYQINLVWNYIFSQLKKKRGNFAAPFCVPPEAMAPPAPYATAKRWLENYIKRKKKLV